MRAGLAGLAAALMCGSAMAADLPSRAAPIFPVAAPLLQPWDGFYSGFGIGYMWSRVSVRQPAASGSYDLDGTTGIRFIGRDWQFGQVVAGLQAEIGIHETKGRLGAGPVLFGAQSDQLWSAGFKGRVGYAFGMILPYVSLGVGTTQLHQHSAVDFADGDVNRHLGFTAGAGVDIAWTPGFTTRLEYEYGDYGRETYFHDGIANRVDLTTHTVKLAAIFREVPGTGPGGTLAPGRGGSYAGVMAGYTLADTALRRPGGARTSSEPDGFEAGLFSGYDLRLGTVFVGFDGTFMGSDVTGRGTGAAGPIRTDILWSGTTRGRFGGTFGAFSPYIAAGFALAQVETVSLASGNLDIGMVYGGTAGIGVDYAITDRWFTRAEYSYTSYARSKPRLYGVSNRRDLDRHDIRFGIGYRLGE